jgi:hypothetical protein
VGGDDPPDGPDRPLGVCAQLTPDDWRSITSATIDRLADLLEYPSVLLLPADEAARLARLLELLRALELAEAAAQ